MSSGSQVQHIVVVGVVGVGLVGSELVDQLSKLPSPELRDQFQLISLSSSRSTVYYDIGSDWWSNWRQDLTRSTIGSDPRALVTKLTQISTVEEVAGLRQGVSFSVIPVLVDNTSSEAVARLYPFFLNNGVNIVTPNKKAFSSELAFYEEIVAASLKTGARFYNESTVGAGLPIISTIKDLVATGDKVRIELGTSPLRASIVLCRSSSPLVQGHENRGCILRHAELHFQRVLGWEERGWAELLFYRFNRQAEWLHGTLIFSPSHSPEDPLGAGGCLGGEIRSLTAGCIQEPNPADDLNGADVARKLTILSRYIPSLRDKLPNGYKSVSTKSLVPAALDGIESGEEFIKKLPEYDQEFDKLRSDAFKENQVLRFVGVIDVASGVIKADLERWVLS